MSAPVPADGGPPLRVRDAHIAASLVHSDTRRCPRCQSQDVFLEGVYQRSFLERCAGGERQAERQLPQLVREVRAIVCVCCQVRFEIVADSELLERKDYFRLKLEEAQRLGSVPPQVPLPKQMLM